MCWKRVSNFWNTWKTPHSPAAISPTARQQPRLGRRPSQSIHSPGRRLLSARILLFLSYLRRIRLDDSKVQLFQLHRISPCLNRKYLFIFHLCWLAGWAARVKSLSYQLDRNFELQKPTDKSPSPTSSWQKHSHFIRNSNQAKKSCPCQCPKCCCCFAYSCFPFTKWRVLDKLVAMGSSTMVRYAMMGTQERKMAAHFAKLTVATNALELPVFADANWITICSMGFAPVRLEFSYFQK